MRVIVTSLLLLLAGCAANPEKVQQVADDEAARLQAPTKPLSSFAEYELKPMTFAGAIEAEERKLTEAREFEQNLRAKILPLLEEWRESSTGGLGTLLIESEIKGLRIVSGGARFWAGAFAGESFIDLDLRLIYDATGEAISDVRIYRDAGSMAGAWSIGRSDQNLDEYMVTIIHEYLSDNY